MFDIEQYLAGGVRRLAVRAVKESFQNPKESSFLTAFAKSAQEASVRRQDYARNGEHIRRF